jgi:hypothetical protein
MSRETLVRRFAAVGARVSVPRGPWRGDPRIDVGADRGGEFFDIRFRGRERATELEVIDVRPHERHLLLLVRVGDEKSKFLCGHDERHWFVAAIPEAARGVTGVASAKAALVPDLVWERVARTRPKDQFRRRNRAYVRQGEWFFVAAPDVNPPEALALRDEPLTRGGTPHVMQFAFRRGGELVYVQNRNAVLTQEEYDAIPRDVRKKHFWERLVRDAEVYARGTVRHPDHATIHLPSWHRVLMNTEQEARAMQHVAFLD